MAEQSKGVYQLRMYGFETSPFKGSLSVDSLYLEPDYDTWKALHDQGQQVPRTLLELRTGPVVLYKLSYAEALFQGNVQVQELSVQQPALLLSVMQPDTTQQHLPLHQTARGFLYGLHIGRIDVREASLRYRHFTKRDTLLAVQQFGLVVKEFKLDSASYQARDRSFYAQKYTFNAQQAAYLLGGGHYQLKADTINVNTDTRAALLAGVSLKPLLGPAELAKAQGEAVTHQEAEVKQIALQGIDFSEYSRYNKLRVKYVGLQTPTLSAF